MPDVGCKPNSKNVAKTVPAYLAGIETSSGQCLFLSKEELHLHWARKTTHRRPGEQQVILSAPGPGWPEENAGRTSLESRLKLQVGYIRFG